MFIFRQEIVKNQVLSNIMRFVSLARLYVSWAWWFLGGEFHYLTTVQSEIFKNIFLSFQNLVYWT